MKPHFEKAVIIGVGLIGGSLARVLKNRKLADRVVGCGRSRANIDEALKLGIIDETAEAEDAVRSADLVMLCGPVLSIIPTLERIAPYIKGGALVSDAGSTKRDIAREGARIAGGRFFFIGSHPIAGTEKSGAAASFETLFEKHKCIITPWGDTPEEPLQSLTALWKAAGMETVTMDPESHDRIFAAVSHLPHLVVYSLVNTVSGEDMGKDVVRFAAGGFKDFTRIASSPAEMWADISLQNGDILLDLMEKMKGQMEMIAKAIREKDKETLTVLFERSGNFRKRLP